MLPVTLPTQVINSRATTKDTAYSNKATTVLQYSQLTIHIADAVLPVSIMSGAAQGDQNTTKTNVSDVKDNSKPLDGSGNKPPAAQLEEDDEFEDFPVEGTSLQTKSTGRL